MAEAVDALLNGDVVRAGDILIARSSAVELATTTKKWDVARHLELIPGLDVSAVPAELLDLATSAEKKDRRVSGTKVNTH